MRFPVFGSRTFLPSISYHPQASIGEHRMTNAKSNLRVQVVDDDIIVTLPGDAIRSPAASRHPPQLIEKYISDRDDPRVAMRLSEFLARAWRLADDKTSRLGLGRVTRRLRSTPSLFQPAIL